MHVFVLQHPVFTALSKEKQKMQEKHQSNAKEKKEQCWFSSSAAETKVPAEGFLCYTVTSE